MVIPAIQSKHSTSFNNIVGAGVQGNEETDSLAGHRRFYRDRSLNRELGDHVYREVNR